jgi:hypothetical protein
MPAHRNGGAGTDDSDEGIEAAHRAGMTATDMRLVYRPAWRFWFSNGWRKISVGQPHDHDGGTRHVLALPVQGEAWDGRLMGAI